MIEKNLIEVQKKIMESGLLRDSKEITLIAVSKTQSIERIEKAYKLGIRDFGENRVQELLQKIEKLPKDIRWHMIGHLQTNKVRQIIGKVDLIHSIDSLHLADAIETEGKKKGIYIKGLLEFNIAKEESKYGFQIEEMEKVLEHMTHFQYLSIEGLMTVAPFVKDAEENRKVFKKLHQLSVDIKSKNVDNISMRYLSMGMTGDYEVAIQEGATHIRVGTGIFGAR